MPHCINEDWIIYPGETQSEMDRVLKDIDRVLGCREITETDRPSEAESRNDNNGISMSICPKERKTKQTIGLNCSKDDNVHKGVLIV
jgi:hypothetical protein